MAKLQLTLACGDYDFLRPLIDGEIQPQGIELNVLDHAFAGTPWPDAAP